ncbi:MAG TPA: HAD-IIIC family phosphatase [Gemmatimonadaceae bacterium]|nr:HAD-IIIC family phosphatase [Gemmatimonadaceae bacterium]
MFELGSGFSRLSADASPFSDGTLEAALGATIVRRSLTVWSEHCSECAMPGCYSTCAFYTPRQDYKCRRFPGGVALLPATEHSAAPMRLRFGKWARLMAYGPAALQPVADAKREESRALWIAQKVSEVTALRGLAAPVLRRATNARLRPTAWDLASAEQLYFVMEIVNPAAEPVALSLSCKIIDEPGATTRIAPVEAILDLAPGYNVRALPVTAFMQAQHFGRRFVMQLAPASHEEHPELVFGFLDIAELSGAPAADIVVGRPRAPKESKASAPKIKCVLWDLDNTMWDGVLVEDGLLGVRLRQDAVQMVHELDRKGILQSVVSKNDHEVAMTALEHFGIASFFLVPQISWAPKSNAISVIARKLNIGSDTFAFVDDQEFERAEVASRHPEVLAIDAREFASISTHERFAVEVTSEAASRRALYQEEEQRTAALEASAMDYEEFLRSCSMRIEIAELSAADIPRSHELAQRTNQLNIWASRYTADQLQALLAPDSSMRGYTVRAEDRFGSYGLVGLCIVDESEHLVRDLMFSCRIQGKLVGETFVAWLSDRYQGAGPLNARYKQSAKNGPARAMLEAVGFERRESLGEGERWTQTRPFRRLAELSQIIDVRAPGTGSSAPTYQSATEPVAVAAGSASAS